MALTLTPSGQSCGATITGINLKHEPNADATAQLRAIWLEHHVIAFPDQRGLFGTLGYIVGIDRMDDAEATALLAEMYRWHARPEFQYRHNGRPGC